MRRVLVAYPQESRSAISRRICELLGWMQPNGQPQDVAAREILRRLESMNLISLPLPRHNGYNDRRLTRHGSLQENLLFSDTEPLLEGPLSQFGAASLEPITTPEQARVFREMIARYHYLGYRPTVGRAMKYFIHLSGQTVGAISWGSACWKLASRDTFIGWDGPTRIKNLQYLAGNHRFLILPWVRVKHLASHVLSLAVRQLPQDWKNLYGLELFCLESFVDPSRFKGTCYKAASWIYLGKSKGSSKSGNSYHFHGHAKDIYVYPLTRDFKSRLSLG